MVWLFAVVLSSVLAYLTRPEGLVVPVSLVATFMILPFVPSLALPTNRRWRVLGWLLVGCLLVAGPFMLLKGGISSKPSMSRLLGLSARARRWPSTANGRWIPRSRAPKPSC